MNDDHQTPFTAMAQCQVPIQLAPMAGAVSVELSLAVIAAGAHASLPCVNQPATIVARQLDALAAKTTAFSANFIAPLADPDALDAAIERAAMVDFHAGPPNPSLIGRVRDGGRHAAWQVGSVDDARAAEAAGCDLLVVQGSEAGGRLAGNTPLLALLPEVVDAVGVPVLAAGGIAKPADVAAALGAGADGVRVGTRFIASSESAAHPAWIEALLAAAEEDSVVTTAFVRDLSPPASLIPHRVLRSSIDAAENATREILGEMEIGGRVREIRPFEAPPPDRTFHGHADAMPFYAGVAAGSINSVMTAAEIVAELAAGMPAGEEAVRR